MGSDDSGVAGQTSHLNADVVLEADDHSSDVYTCVILEIFLSYLMIDKMNTLRVIY